MPIPYTVVPNTLTTPPSFAPRVVTRQTISLDTLVGETAAETAQSKEALLAAFTVVAEKIREQLDAGNAVLWQDTLQIEPTLSGKMLTAASDLPPDSVWGISVKAVGGFLTRFKAGAVGERVAGDDKAPDIIEAAALNANLLALRPRDIVVLRGYRLAFDPSHPDEGVYLDPVTGGAPVRVAVANIRKKGEKETEFQWPEGLPANTQYRVRLECRRRGGEERGSAVGNDEARVRRCPYMSWYASTSTVTTTSSGKGSLSSTARRWRLSFRIARVRSMRWKRKFPCDFSSGAGAGSLSVVPGGSDSARRRCRVSVEKLARASCGERTGAVWPGAGFAAILRHTFRRGVRATPWRRHRRGCRLCRQGGAC